jgi:hypothetical protein
MKTVLATAYLIVALSLSGCVTDRKGVAEANIELDNGEKWIVDRAMLEYIIAMEIAVKDFGPDGDISKLKAMMKDNLKGVTSNCTMEGQAHAELHKWLIPLMESVDDVDDKESTERLKQHFMTFHTYFK